MLSLRTRPVSGTLLEKTATGIRRWVLKTDMQDTHARHRRGGRFFGRRVNCELVPSLPVWVVARVLDDPRKIPICSYGGAIVTCK
jgi:hypothetical protein